MEFREDIGQYVFEYEGLIFAWDELGTKNQKKIFRIL